MIPEAVLPTMTACPSGSPVSMVSRTESSTIEIRLHGELDASSTTALRDALLEAVSAGDANLVVDLADVSFVSASTLGVLVETREALRARNHTMTLRAAPRCVRRILLLTGLEHLLPDSPTGGLTGDRVATGLPTDQHAA